MNFLPSHCASYDNLSIDMAIADYLKPNSQQDELSCFCYAQTKKATSMDSLEALKFEGVDENLCMSWFKTYLFEKYSVVGTALMICVINIV